MLRLAPAVLVAITVALLALGSPAKVRADQPTQLWLPWEGGQLWTYTQGPHGQNLEGLDFQPPDAAGKPCELFHSSFWVTAAADGDVTVLPNAVEVDHGNGFSSGYYHLENIQVHTGDHVNTGTRLGAPGCCPDGDGDGCYATAPHVHFYTVQDGARRQAFGVNLGGWQVMDDGCLQRGEERSCPLEGGGTTGAGRIVSNSPRQGQSEPSSAADIALMIDDSAVADSGSMSRTEAALAFLQAARSDDRVAVIDFNNTARVAVPLTAATTDGGVTGALVDAVGAGDSSDPTNIRLGMVSGCAELLANSKASARAAVLFSDGHHEVGSFSGAVECFTESGIPVFTYGVGDANDALLQDIANKTGGQFTSLADVDSPYCDFRRIRSIISGDPVGGCSTYELKKGEALTLPVNVPADQDQAVLEIRWRDRRTAAAEAADSTPVAPKILSPSGRVLEIPFPGIKVEQEDGAVRYKIAYPLAGQWSLVVNLNDTAPDDGLFITFAASTIPQALPFGELTEETSEPTPEPTALDESETPEPTPTERPTRTVAPTPTDAPAPGDGDTPTPSAERTAEPTPAPTAEPTESPSA